MSTESKIGLGDKIKQKLHFGKPGTHTQASNSSTEHENTSLTIGGTHAGLQPGHQHEAQDSVRLHTPPQQTEPFNNHATPRATELSGQADTTPKTGSVPASTRAAEAHQAVEFVGIPAGPASIPLAVNVPTATGDQQRSGQAGPSATPLPFPGGKQLAPTAGENASGPVPVKQPEQAPVAHTATQRLAATKPSVFDVGSDADRRPKPEAGLGQHPAGEHDKPAPKDSATHSANAPGAAQEALQQGVTRVQEVMQPVAEKGRGAGEAIAESAKAVLQQVQEAAAPYLSSAASQTQQLGSLGRQKAGQAYSAVSSELERQGVPEEASQKVAGIQEAVKTYGAAGQERATEYLQQAVVKAEAIGKDAENQSIVLKILGSLSLVWLAFGFSLTALLGLGLSAAIALVLSRYSRRSSVAAQARSHNFNDAKGHAPAQLQASGVETHYPAHQTGVHPDASINVANPRV